MCERREVRLKNCMREERIRDEKREERGGEEGHVLMDGGMSHTLPPPKGGREGCGAALTHPTAASPLLKGEWMMVMVMMDLDNQQSSVS